MNPWRWSNVVVAVMDYWKPVVALVLLVTLVTGGAYTYAYVQGRNAERPKVAVAEGQAAVATTNDANAKGALTASSERRKVEVTIREIERKTGNVVAEARITGDSTAAIVGWSDGIDRMRQLADNGSLAAADPHADPDERP